MELMNKFKKERGMELMRGKIWTHIDALNRAVCDYRQLAHPEADDILQIPIVKLMRQFSDDLYNILFDEKEREIGIHTENIKDIIAEKERVKEKFATLFNYNDESDGV